MLRICREKLVRALDTASGDQFHVLSIRDQSGQEAWTSQSSPRQDHPLDRGQSDGQGRTCRLND